MKYKLLGNTGLRVSELCLGTMTFGEDWGWGASKDTCRDLLDTYLEAGGNFIDTANYYTNGSSEKILGELLTSIRHKIVLATKYSLMTEPGNINSGGNQRKNMMYAVDQSLKRLKTDYIDLYWVHIWDTFTPVEEIIQGLNDLVRVGKILHSGISDTPAWMIAKANAIARERNWTSFNAVQLEYNLIERTSERELIPMAVDENISILAWSPLAGGLLSGKYSSKNKKEKDGSRLDYDPRLTEQSLAIADSVIEVAADLQVPASSVALAWTKQNPKIIPVIGARKVEQLRDNLLSINLSLSEQHLQKLNTISKIKLGFPYDFLNADSVRKIIHGSYEVIK